MNLGENIHAHRTRKNLSQSDLADLLNISRQSVSKWENNTAVPDLEKIVKMSEIFEISLDELLKGEVFEKEEKVQIIKEVIIQEPKREGRKTAGVILFCMAFVVFMLLFMLTGSIGGLLYAVPFLVCGIICFTCGNHTGLWCAWAVVLMADAFMRVAMGITIGMIRHTLIWTYEMNYARLAIAWIFLAIVLLMVMITVLILSKKPLNIQNFTYRHLFIGWIGWLILFLCHQVVIRTEFYFNLLSYVISIPMIYYLYSMISEWLRTGLLIYMIIYSIRVYRANKVQHMCHEN